MPNEKKPDIERLVWPKDGNTFQWLDRLETMLGVATKAGTAYLGYQAFEKVVPGSGLAGAIVSQVALRLANANNLASGVAGVATLTGLGILNVHQEGTDYVRTTTDWIGNMVAGIEPAWRDIGLLPPLSEEYT